MTKRKKSKNGLGEELHIVKTAGYKATRRVKKDRTVNRRAGLHDKKKNLEEGEVRVKRRKPLALKHVRRMRKVAAVASLGVVGAIAIVGVGFLAPAKEYQLDGEFETVCYVAPTDGTKPTDHTLVENVGYMNYVLQQQAYWSSQGTTNVNAVALGVPAKQSVDNYKKYYNGVLISVDCSFSGVSKLLQYGEQFCQYENAVLTRYSTSNETADLQKGMDAPWSTDPATGWTIKGFKQNRGFPPYEFSVYVLNEKTIANAYDYTVIDNYDGTYSMKLTLNTNTGVDETSADYYYRLQMQKNGGLNDLPTIYYTTLTYTFDESWRVLKLEVEDSYTAKAMGMNSECTSRTETNYSYAEENAKNTFWDDYFKAEYERLKDTLTEGIVNTEVEENAMGYLSGAFASVLTDGAIFKVDLNFDELNLNGVVCLDLSLTDGVTKINDVAAQLGDVLVWLKGDAYCLSDKIHLGGDTLYINDGNSKYKLNIKDIMGSTDSEATQPVAAMQTEEGADGGFDASSLMDQLCAGTLTIDKESGITTLDSTLELFGLKVNLFFEFGKSDAGISLNYVNAEIPVGEKVIKAKLVFGEEKDRPTVPEDVSDYTNILNDGVTLKVDVNIDELNLSGLAKIILNNGKFEGVHATLGDIAVYFDCPHNMLYLTDGNVKYKLDVNALSVSGNGSANIAGLLGGINIENVLADAIKNLSVDKTGIKTGFAVSALENTLNAALSVKLFGVIEVGATLGFDNHNLSVTAALTNEKLELPADLDTYTDVLNDGIAVDLSISLDDMTLTGIAKIYLKDGKLTGVYAQLGDLIIYYDCTAENSGTPRNMLYFTEGSVKYKLNLNDVSNGSNGSVDISALLDKLNIGTLVKDVIANLTAKDGSISTGATVNIEQLKTTLNASVELKIKGGIGATVNFKYGEKRVSLTANLTDKNVTVPDLTSYSDILNSEITIDLSFTLLTNESNVENENGEIAVNYDEVTLKGTVTLCLENGKFGAVRADFGGVAVYYEVTENALYIKIGTSKIMVNLAEVEVGSTSLTSLLSGDKKLIAEDLPAILADLINNLVANAKVISTNTNLTVLDAIVPLSAQISLDGGLKVEAEAVLLGIDVIADVKFGSTPVEKLGEEDKAEYINILKDADKLLDSLIGDHISATVSGKLYSYDGQKYATYGNVKYDFTASLEFDRANPVDESVDTVEDAVAQITADNSLYLHINIELKAKAPDDDSVYLDLVIMNANPNYGDDGRTTGGYTLPDDKLDVYVSISKLGESGNPLKIYAPADELLNIVSMLGATLNLKGLVFEDKTIADAVGQIAGLLDEMLISKSLPQSVQEKFASLGESLIPQILGTSLQEILDKLVADANKEVDKVENRKFLLSDKYVKSITNSQNNLKVVLNSSIIYETENDVDDLVVNFNRLLNEDSGVYYIDSITLDNIYFGDNNVHKLNIGMKLGYNEIVKPAANDGNALKDYLNANGLDALLNAAVNSATHKTTEEEKSGGATTQYSLNKNYYIAGDVTLGIGKYAVSVNVKGLSVTIDDDNNVTFDVSYRVNKLALAVSETADVDLSVRGDMMYIRRTVKGKSTTRIMPASEFAKNASSLKDNLNFMFNFSGLVSGILDMSLKDDSMGSKEAIEFNDYGDYISKFLTKYTYGINSDGDSVWSLALNGATLGKMVGVDLSNIDINFYAKPTEEGYLLKSLTLNGKLFNMLTFKTIGNGLTLCNPADSDFNGEWNSVSLDGGITVDKKLTCDLASDKACGVNGYSWVEILGGISLKEIKAHTNWVTLTADLGKSYLEYSDGCSLDVAMLKYEYPANGDFTEFGTRQLVIYNKNNSSRIYTYLSRPSLTEVPKVEQRNAVWSKSYVDGADGTISLRVVYEVTYKVSVFSDYQTTVDYELKDGVYSYTVAEAYGTVLLPKDIFIKTEAGSVYKLKGYLLNGETDLYDGFTSMETDEYGNECYVAEVTGELTFTAVWERMYAVDFVSDNGTVTGFYYAGETLNKDNTPAVPEKTGYSGSWNGADGTVIAADTEYVFNALYEIESYVITLQSSLEVTDDGFAKAGENYVMSADYTFGDSVVLPELASVSTAYSFKGFYANAEFTGEPVTEFTAGESVTYYAKWEGKKITVNYRSDISFPDSKVVTEGENTYYIPANTTTWTFGYANELLVTAADDSNIEFLGWFMPDGESYKYFASANDIKNYLEERGIEGETAEITLWAAWSDGITFSNLKFTKSGLQWRIKGDYAVSYVGDISNDIANKVSLTYTSSYYFYLSFDGGKSVSDTLNNKKPINNKTDMSFDSGNNNSGNALFQSNVTASVELTSVITCGGYTLGSITQKSDWISKS